MAIMLQQLRESAAWQLMEERLNWLIETRTGTLTSMPGDSSLAEIQRILGQIEAFRLILKQPDMLQKEWEKARKDAIQPTEGNA